ncbi:hypothetical protein DACRYDRAFT_18928 [Dacryopinax primogenitus]|uniref:Uncharacterized protein n=1 Tax=Dacryopinax primogenitus (strain DJM 731) TaxID=1858805 RepID=M5G0B1_DACPD|nr:uncharacterized protein DACRYDRAFT_18928 [Dacryopinax primogenitus]EJT97227.1 hypothetical protein DACRYDRAFT_18928 [Dacryopinax primogenitus]
MPSAKKKLIEAIFQYWHQHPKQMHWAIEDVKHWYCAECGGKYLEPLIAFTELHWGLLWTKCQWCKHQFIWISHQMPEADQQQLKTLHCQGPTGFPDSPPDTNFPSPPSSKWGHANGFPKGPGVTPDGVRYGLPQGHATPSMPTSTVKYPGNATKCISCSQHPHQKCQNMRCKKCCLEQQGNNLKGGPRGSIAVNIGSSEGPMVKCDAPGHIKYAATGKVKNNIDEDSNKTPKMMESALLHLFTMVILAEAITSLPFLWFLLLTTLLQDENPVEVPGMKLQGGPGNLYTNMSVCKVVMSTNAWTVPVLDKNQACWVEMGPGQVIPFRLHKCVVLKAQEVIAQDSHVQQEIHQHFTMSGPSPKKHPMNHDSSEYDALETPSKKPWATSVISVSSSTNSVVSISSQDDPIVIELIHFSAPSPANWPGAASFKEVFMILQMYHNIHMGPPRRTWKAAAEEVLEHSLCLMSSKMSKKAKEKSRMKKKRSGGDMAPMKQKVTMKQHITGDTIINTPLVSTQSITMEPTVPTTDPKSASKSRHGNKDLPDVADQIPMPAKCTYCEEHGKDCFKTKGHWFKSGWNCYNLQRQCSVGNAEDACQGHKIKAKKCDLMHALPATKHPLHPIPHTGLLA